MTTKNFHGFTLWAVPRFHRSDVTPLPTAAAQPGWAESFDDDVRAPEPKAEAVEPVVPAETCH